MALYVVPKMKPIFQAQDARAYAGFVCQTCHGEDMEQVNFKMPNQLYALAADNPIEAAMEDDAETTHFMVQRVVPAMAKLLDVEPSSAGKVDGFGCFGCHQKE
jgi:hypothetical protein